MPCLHVPECDYLSCNFYELKLHLTSSLAHQKAKGKHKYVCQKSVPNYFINGNSVTNLFIYFLAKCFTMTCTMSPVEAWFQLLLAATV